MPDIAIVMPTWNKERYVAAALESVFRQKTSRSFRVIVADDHSTDRTLAIVADFSRAHPGVITVLPSDANRKLFRNVVRAYALLGSPYFCVLDPDDYWTDENHLEKAVGFLEAHPDFTVYSAGIERLERDGRRVSCDFAPSEVDSDFADYLEGRAVVAFTQTCVYRNVVFAKGLPEKVAHPPFPSMEKTLRGDSFRNFLHIREGKAHYSPAIEACYRITDEGVYQGVGELERKLMDARFFADMWRYDDERHAALLARSRTFYSFVREGALGELAGSPLPEEKIRSLLAEMADLERIYAEASDALDAHWLGTLPFRQRFRYLGYLKLRHKRIVE